MNYIMHRWYGDGEVLIVLENAQQQLSCCKGYVEAQESRNPSLVEPHDCRRACCCDAREHHNKNCNK